MTAKKEINLFFDMDGVLAKFIYAGSEKLHEEGYFRNLPPVDTVVKAAKRLKKEGYNIHIMSCYLADSSYALPEKAEWCRENIPEANAIFAPVGSNKGEILEYYLGRKVRKSDILVDDYNPNLCEFKIAGGTAIKLLNGLNSANSWEGYKVNAGNCYHELNKVITKIEKGA